MNDFVQKRRRAPLSLTALIDIVFILLMFFMVTTSFTPLRSITLTQGVSESSKSDELPNFLLLREDGLIAQHSDSGLTFKTKAEQIKHLVSEFNSQPENNNTATKNYIVVPAEKTAVQIVIDTLQALDQAGISANLGSPSNAFSAETKNEVQQPWVH